MMNYRLRLLELKQKQLLIAADAKDDIQWISTETGSHIPLKDGVIVGGMGGKFNGKKINELSKKEKPKTPEKAKKSDAPKVQRTYSEQKQDLMEVFDDTMDYSEQSLEVMSNPKAKEYGLNAAEAVALKLYSSLFYANINTALRNDESDENGIKAKKVANVVSEALAKLPNYEGKVYRQTQLTQEQLSRYKEGDIVTEKAFTSTSKIKGGANFSDLPVSIEIINSKTGKDISSFSDEKDEQEILFDKGTKFKVLSKKADNGKTMLYLEEV